MAHGRKRLPALRPYCGGGSETVGRAVLGSRAQPATRGELVRLHGLDAPELDQIFWWRGERIACGMMALAALEALTAGIELRCRVVERDRHGRLVAKVFSPDGVDLGRRLVLAGWALAYRQYSTDYVDAEAEARRARRGLWRGTFAKPWEWRSIAPRVRPSPSSAPRRGPAQF